MFLRGIGRIHRQEINFSPDSFGYHMILNLPRANGQLKLNEWRPE